MKSASLERYGRNSVSLTLLALIIGGLSLMLFRSMWFDEGMLLKNIVENDGLWEFVHPLPFHEQAQPMLASVFHGVVVKYVALEQEVIRLLTLVTGLAFTIPILWASGKSKLGHSVPLLIFYCTLPTIGFYYTEIKHYAFEIAASFAMLYVVFEHHKNNLSTARAVILVSLVSTVGFSTLIPAITIISFFFAKEVYFNKGLYIGWKLFAAFAFAGLVVIFTYLHMKYLTGEQLSTHDVYVSKGLVEDTKALVYVVLRAYGETFFGISLVASLLALFASRSSFLFSINIIFIVIASLVVVGKLSGFYPVVSKRHIVWLIPFSMVIVAFLLAEYSGSGKSMFRYACAGLLVALGVQALLVTYELFPNSIPERAQYNDLYGFVAELPPSKILIYPYAQPTLEYHMRTHPELRKHDYVGIFNDPKIKKERLRSRVNRTFERLPTGEFYYLISQLAPIGDPAESRWSDHRETYVEGKLAEHGCDYSEVFVGRRVQLLKMDCER